MALHMNLALTAEPTISDIEQTVQRGLEELRGAPLNDKITAALKFLTPPGYRPVAQLEEDGRKKRSTAAASNWNPETGEIVIYFEPLEVTYTTARESIPQLRPADSPSKFSGLIEEVEKGKRYDPLLMTPAERNLSSERTVRKILGEAVEPLVTAEQIQQLCSALAEAEKVGRAFIALKRFRDDELTTRGYSWAGSLAHRQAVLAKAIDTGAVVTSQIPNPKAPQHPTTTVKLNRESVYAVSVTPRFQPIRAKDGASASEILLRDRGRF
jgi:hypothetical protein